MLMLTFLLSLLFMSTYADYEEVYSPAEILDHTCRVTGLQGATNRFVCSQWYNYSIANLSPFLQKLYNKKLTYDPCNNCGIYKPGSVDNSPIPPDSAYAIVKCQILLQLLWDEKTKCASYYNFTQENLTYLGQLVIDYYTNRSSGHCNPSPGISPDGRGASLANCC